MVNARPAGRGRGFLIARNMPLGVMGNSLKKLDFCRESASRRTNAGRGAAKRTTIEHL
jgi:hypothetical protein